MKDFIVLTCVRRDAVLKLRPHHICEHAANDGFRILYASLNESRPNVSIAATEDRKCRDLFLRFSCYTNFRAGKSIFDSASVEQLADMLESPPVILVNAPYWARFAIMLRNLTSGVLIYDVLDRFEAFKDVEAFTSLLMEYHDALLRNADIVTFTAKDMHSYIDGAQEAYHIPNGVDYAHWDCLRNFYPRNPIIGYFGVMNYWFDTHVVSHLKRVFRLQLIGSIDNKTAEGIFKPQDYRQANEYLGVMPYKKVPEIARRWSAGIIPFKTLSLTQSTDPNKFYEYYALGLPVVATRLNEIVSISETMPSEIRPHLVQSGHQREWENEIRKAIERDNNDLVQARKDWAKQNSWELRWQSFKEIIEKASRE